MVVLKPNVSNSSAVSATATVEIRDLFSVADTSALTESSNLHLGVLPLSLTLIDESVIGDVAGRLGEDIRGELTAISDDPLLEIIS